MPWYNMLHYELHITIYDITDYDCYDLRITSHILRIRASAGECCFASPPCMVRTRADCAPRALRGAGLLGARPAGGRGPAGCDCGARLPLGIPGRRRAAGAASRPRAPRRVVGGRAAAPAPRRRPTARGGGIAPVRSAAGACSEPVRSRTVCAVAPRRLPALGAATPSAARSNTAVLAGGSHRGCADVSAHRAALGRTRLEPGAERPASLWHRRRSCPDSRPRAASRLATPRQHAPGPLPAAASSVGSTGLVRTRLLACLRAIAPLSNPTQYL